MPQEIRTDIEAYEATGVSEFITDVAVSGIDSPNAGLDAPQQLATDVLPSDRA